MGFYGNITNTSKIQFVFDKTYQNRKQMEENMATDNVYIGRYVLVDYDLNFPGKDYARLYLKDNKFYFSPEFEESTRALSSNKPYYIEETNEDDEIIIVVNPEKLNEDSANQMLQNYMLFDGEPIYVWDEENELEVFYSANYNELSNYPIFEKIVSPSDQVGYEGGFYHNNYLIDQVWWKQKTGETTIGRGWDSTVWQKVYTDDKEKYVMIAELNSVVPTFGIKVDPPTLDPMTPHFDADSSSLYYKLHVQPNWGFRVANYENLTDEEKEKYGSDTYIKNEGYKYDSTLNKLRWSNNNYDGAIYYNKKGFDSDYHREKPNKTDEISVKNTGNSGYEYSDHYGIILKDPKYHADIQELYINLPSIGNAVSDLYDVLYGEGTPVGNGDYSKRNKSVAWDSYSGERLVEANDEGNGYDFSPDKVASAAGAINSIHDLMGMIIINDEDNIEAENALDDYIYYNNGTFKIKNLTYDFESADNQEAEKIEEVTLKDFNDNNYYYKKDKNFYYAESYSTGAQYVTLDDITEAYITDYDYKPNTYYTKTVTGSYELGKEDKPRNTNYYVVPEFDGQLTVAISNEKVENGTFFFPPDTGSETYIKEFFNPSFDETTMVGSGLFKPVTENGEIKLIPYSYDNSASLISPLYWWEDYKATKDYEFGTGESVLVYDQDTGKKTALNMVSFESGKYFYENKDTGTYEFAQTLDDIKADKKYYKLPDDKKFEQITGVINGKKYYFYTPDTYYYKESNNYLLAQDELKLKDNYYSINDYNYTNSDTLFYEPNKYYYIDEDGDYILDGSPNFDLTKTYYKYYQDKYILTTDNKNYNYGEKCNPNVDYQSLGIPIGFKKEKYEWKELKGFARSLNTIHGLILKINQMLKMDDNLTRDTTTVQGCINQLNDIIDRFNVLKPNQLAIVNQYGKITSGEANGDNWISIDTTNGKVQLNHIGPVTGTATTVSNDAPTFGSTFNITDYHFDDKGHKYSTTIHTVKIPQGSHTNSDNINGQKVITNLAFNATSGAITSNSANLGDVWIADKETLSSRLSTLQSNIDQEITDRTAAVNAEKEAREAAITAEEQARANADSAEAEARAKAITAEANARETKDNELAGNIADLTSSTNTEIGGLDSRLKTLEDKVSTWDTAEQNAKDYANSLASNYDAAGTADKALDEAKKYADNLLVDIIKSDTKFSYNIGEEEISTSPATIQELFDYIGWLEYRIKTLENTMSSGEEEKSTE